MICTLWTPFQAERDWKNSYREILLIPLYIFYSLCIFHIRKRFIKAYRCIYTKEMVFPVNWSASRVNNLVVQPWIIRKYTHVRIMLKMYRSCLFTSILRCLGQQYEYTLCILMFVYNYKPGRDSRWSKSYLTKIDDVFS